MANNIEKMIATTFMEMAEGLETGSFGKKPKIAMPLTPLSAAAKVPYPGLSNHDQSASNSCLLQ